MKRRRKAPIAKWVSETLDVAVVNALERLRSLRGCERVAIMPDVHLAEDVCIGTVIATRGTLYPEAVGGDIGCGLGTLALDGSADELLAADTARRIL